MPRGVLVVAYSCCRRINTTTSLVVLFHLPRAERFVRHALLAEPTFLDLRRGCSFYPSLGNSEEMVNSTLPCPIGIDSPLCLLSQHTWRRILPRRCHLDRRRGGCCPATATGANPHHVRRRPERLNCCRPSPFSVACPVLPFRLNSLSNCFFFKIRDKGIICRESQLIRSGLYPFRINPK